MYVKRLGLIFNADQGADWMHTHAAYPTPIKITETVIRVFLIIRDEKNRGSVGYIDISIDEPDKILAVSACPCLTPGPLGTFSDRGVSLGSIHRIDNDLWLYYMGWNKSADVPFRNAIGLAIDSKGSGDEFKPAFEGPILDRSRHDPFTLSYPYVIPPENPNDDWQMFYGTSRAGGDREDNMLHVITSATSKNGIDWYPSGFDMIALMEGEYGLSRPWYHRTNGNEFIFFSIRKKTYSIGVVKKNHITGIWDRINSNLLGSSCKPWENQASCYPAIISANGRTLMFYNGNRYGLTGLGVAEVFEDKD